MRELKKRVVLLGKTYAGKTTICQYLNRQELRYHKTQAIEASGANLIDTPGEFSERRFLYGMLQVTAADAEIVLFIKDATEEGDVFPPYFSSMFTKPVIGVITKKDLADETMLRKAEIFLNLAGAHKIFAVSVITGEGFEELLAYIESL